MKLLVRLAAVLAAICGAQALTAAPKIDLPQIVGPVPVTTESGESYRGSNEQPVAGPGLPMPELDKVGYVQEEYVVSGTVDGKPYKTSLLVRRPKDMKRFTGLVGVETIHAAGAIPFWGVGREVWAPGGHGWVAVASQRSALEMQVKKFNPKRYAELFLPEAPAGINGMAASPQDRISQSIMTQVGALLKSNPANGPFKGGKVRYLLMGGSSQTGGTTLRYIVQSHATVRLAKGKPVYDGYMPAEAFPGEPIGNVDVPIVHAVGEGDFGLFRRGNPMAAFANREDSDTARSRFRAYQFAGASHVPTRGRTTGMKPGEYPSQFPSAPLYKMALLHLVDWVTKGKVPPHGPRLDQVNGVMARDEHGNAKGGIRSPWVDVPTAKIIAAPSLGPGDNASRAQMGIQENFPREKLVQLYGTRENYLKLFNASIDKMVAGRWITTADGAKLKTEELAQPPM